jgi:hypothetical protein
MGRIFSKIISNFITITGDALSDTLIIAIIFIIVGGVSYAVVGYILPEQRMSKFRSALYWLIFIPLFLVLCFFSWMIVIFSKWLILNSSSVLIALSVFILLISISVVIYILVHIRRRRYNSIISNSVQSQPKIEPAKPVIKQSITVPVCKKCGSIMVKRSGKYGEFLGCTQYPKCRYTESIR